MKKLKRVGSILGMFAMLSAAAYARAEAIDERLDAQNSFISVGEPTYRGLPFLAKTAYEDATSTGNSARAAELICQYLGYGRPTAYSSVLNAKDDESADGTWTAMWTFEGGNLVLYSYPNGYWDRCENARGKSIPCGKSSRISHLTCTRQ